MRPAPTTMSEEESMRAFRDAFAARSARGGLRDGATLTGALERRIALQDGAPDGRVRAARVRPRGVGERRLGARLGVDRVQPFARYGIGRAREAALALGGGHSGRCPASARVTCDR